MRSRWQKMNTGQRRSAVGALVAVAVLAAEARPTPANAATTFNVDCTADPGALAVAVAAATDGDTLSIHGTCRGTFELSHSLTLAGTDGAALDGQGAGTVLKIGSGSTVAVSDLRITGGNATIGGPFNIGAGGIQNSGVLTLTNSSVEGNTAIVSRGQNGAGGIANVFGGRLTVVNSTVNGNSASADAPFNTAVGGIFNSFGSVTIAASTVSDNTASTPSDAFGGILNSAPSSVVTLTNSTVSGNSAAAPGGPGAFASAVGGISNSGGTLTLTSTTLAANTVSEPNGGFLPPVAGVSNFFGGTTTLAGSLVAAQSGGPSCYGLAPTADAGYNLEDEASCGFASANHSLPGTDPLLDPVGLRDNGGPTETIALLGGSPAVDAIPSGANGCGTSLTTDQRGVSRPQGPGCDIGSYESAPRTLVVGIDVKPGETPNPINPKSNGTIPVAILSANGFAPSEVDVSSLRFGRSGDETSLAFCRPSEDLNGDTLPDLVCHFETQAAGFRAGDTEAVLTGTTLDGTPIRGTDSIIVVAGA